jgi:hypothetical protein
MPPFLFAVYASPPVGEFDGWEHPPEVKKPGENRDMPSGVGTHILATSGDQPNDYAWGIRGHGACDAEL